MANEPLLCDECSRRARWIAYISGMTSLAAPVLCDFHKLALESEIVLDEEQWEFERICPGCARCSEDHVKMTPEEIMRVVGYFIGAIAFVVLAWATFVVIKSI